MNSLNAKLALLVATLGLIGSTAFFALRNQSIQAANPVPAPVSDLDTEIQPESSHNHGHGHDHEHDHSHGPGSAEAALDTYALESGETIAVSKTHASIALPQSTAALIEESDLIVVGSPKQAVENGKLKQKRDAEGFAHSSTTTVDFQVKEVIKGEIKKNTRIPVTQQAAIVEVEGPEGKRRKSLLVVDGYRPLRTNARYLLFLKRGLADDADSYFPLGVEYGRVNIDGNDPDSKAEGRGIAAKKIREMGKKLGDAAQRGKGKESLQNLINSPEAQQPFFDAGVDPNPNADPNPSLEPGSASKTQ